MGTFRFKQFDVADDHCGMKICTDSVLLGAWADASGAARICDLGAGSGVLSLMLAQRFPSAEITAIEIDPPAASDAQRNFESSPWSDRLRVEVADALQYEPEAPFDFIISNPPYFASELKSPDLQRAAARHGSGLGIATAIGFASSHLSPCGSLTMVTPADGWQDILYEAELRRLRLRRLCRVSTSPRKPPTRILWQFSRVAGPCLQTSLSIRDGADLSPQCADLTRDFYLDG